MLNFAALFVLIFQKMRIGMGVSQAWKEFWTESSEKERTVNLVNRAQIAIAPVP